MFLAWDAAVLGSSGGGLLGGADGAAVDPLAALRQAGNPAVAPLLDSFTFLAIATSFIGFVLGLSDFIADALQASKPGWALPGSHLRPPTRSLLPAKLHAAPCALCLTFYLSNAAIQPPPPAAAHGAPAPALPAHAGAAAAAGADLPGERAHGGTTCSPAASGMMRAWAWILTRAGCPSPLVCGAVAVSCALTCPCPLPAGCLLFCARIRWDIWRSCAVWTDPCRHGVERAVRWHNPVAHPGRPWGQARAGVDGSSGGGGHCTRASQQRRSAGWLSIPLYQG